MPLTPYHFAAQMQHELNANAHRGDWDAWHPTAAEWWNEVNHHQMKLADAICAVDFKAVQQYTADLGNLMMKAAETFGVANA